MAEQVAGEIRMLANGGVPPGWASCDGQVLQIREHKALFAVLGTTYGGDGNATFALPDLRGRTPIHSNPGITNLGQTGGEQSHSIRVSEIPAHAHGSIGLIGQPAATSGVQLATSPTPTATQTTSATLSISPTETMTESAAGHNNLQPYLTVNFIIALEGASPGRK
jgi:microcystin-dependent protein